MRAWARGCVSAWALSGGGARAGGTWRPGRSEVGARPRHDDDDDDNDNDDDDKEEDGSVSNSSSSSSSSFKTVSQTIAKGAIGVAYTFSNILFNAVALFFVFGIILNVMGYGYEFRAAGGTTAEDGSGDFLHRIPILHVDTIEQIRTERQFDRTYLK